MGNLTNLAIIYGSNAYLQREKEEQYKRLFLKKYADGEVINSDIMDFQSLESHVFTGSLFGGRRMIFVKNFWHADNFEIAEKTKFFDRLRLSCEEVTLVFLESNIDKRTRYGKYFSSNAIMISCEPYDYSQIINWICQYVQQQEKNISLENAKIFFQRMSKIDWSEVKPDFRTGKIDWVRVEQNFGSKGEDLYYLSNEIQKLVLFSGSNEISKEDIMTMTHANNKTVVWDFLASFGKYSAMNDIVQLKSILSSNKGVFEVLGYIFSELRLMAQVVYGVSCAFSSQDIAQMSSIHPFRIKKTIDNAKDLNIKVLKKYYDIFYAIDQKMKQGIISSNDIEVVQISLEKGIYEMYFSK